MRNRCDWVTKAGVIISFVLASTKDVMPHPSSIEGLMDAGVDDDLIKTAMKSMTKYWKKTNEVKDDSDRRSAFSKMKKQLKKKLKGDSNAVDIIDEIEAGKKSKKGRCGWCKLRSHSSDQCW